MARPQLSPSRETRVDLERLGALNGQLLDIRMRHVDQVVSLAWNHGLGDLQHDRRLLVVPGRADFLRGGRPRHGPPVVRQHVRPHRQQMRVRVEANLEEHVVVL